ncbi:rho GTPase-activating protein 5 [Henckelia pumila]|uniref:rho GTPase-activating protein 5 n=1 Tax=Henckelia pumila TaxID=405737 RepID=UPI003C6E3735
MTRLFRSKSCALSMPHFSSSSPAPPSACTYHQEEQEEEEEEEEDEGYFGDFNSDYDSDNPAATTPFISPSQNSCNLNQQPQFSVLAVVAAALRKSLVTCTVEDGDVDSDVDIGWPTDVRHVSHVTFDRFNGFLGIPVELQPEVPRKPPSASASVFGVSPQSMQCSYDHRGNSVPVILLRMQNRLYSEGGLQVEGIFRINAENSQEEIVRKQLNRGVVPHGIDVHCLSGLIKAWFRELPSGVLDSLTSEQVMQCNTEEECTQLVKLLPPTEAALLDWAINLMADVAQQEHQNKMNSRNIAMVFAPNMTQMADPLTALIHAVQVMNFLKTLIVKTLREREDQARPAAASDERDHQLVVKEQSSDDYALQQAPDNNHSRSGTKRRTLAGSFKEEYDMEAEGILNRLSLRRGMRKLRRHPVFQLSKTVKKNGGLEL